MFYDAFKRFMICMIWVMDFRLMYNGEYRVSTCPLYNMAMYGTGPDTHLCAGLHQCEEAATQCI
jgi:hypothetical protein